MILISILLIISIVTVSLCFVTETRYSGTYLFASVFLMYLLLKITTGDPNMPTCIYVCFALLYGAGVLEARKLLRNNGMQSIEINHNTLSTQCSAAISAPNLAVVMEQRYNAIRCCEKSEAMRVLLKLADKGIYLHVEDSKYSSTQDYYAYVAVLLVYINEVFNNHGTVYIKICNDTMRKDMRVVTLDTVAEDCNYMEACSLPENWITYML